MLILHNFFDIFTAWLLFAILGFFYEKKGKTSIAKVNWISLGILGFIQLLLLLSDWGVAYFAGYFSEQLSFISKEGFALRFFSELLLTLSAVLFLFKRIRQNVRLKQIQFILLVLVLLANFMTYGLSPTSFASTIIPGGWHTVISSLASFWGILIWFTIITLMNILPAFLLDRRKKIKKNFL